MATVPGPRADGGWQGSKQILRLDALYLFSPCLRCAGPLSITWLPSGLSPPPSPPQAPASASVDRRLPASGLTGSRTLQSFRPVPFPGNSFPAWRAEPRTRRDRAGSGISFQFLLVPGPCWAWGEPGAHRARPRALEGQQRRRPSPGGLRPPARARGWAQATSVSLGAAAWFRWYCPRAVVYLLGTLFPTLRPEPSSCQQKNFTAPRHLGPLTGGDWHSWIRQWLHCTVEKIISTTYRLTLDPVLSKSFTYI